MTNLVPESEQQYGSILTVLGENAEQNGKLLNKQIEFTHIAFGDANDTYVQPDRKAQGLVNELYRIPVNSVDVLQATPDSVPILKVEAILPDDVNDVVIREFAAVATFNGQSYFHAIGNCARIYVPRPINNGNVSNPVTLEMTFVITSAEPIVEIDPNVVTASREYVNNQVNHANDLLAKSISDINGGDWFIDDGFLVDKDESKGGYFVKKGYGYVSGYAVEMKLNQEISLIENTSFIYVKVWFDLKSNHPSKINQEIIVSSNEMDDYFEDGYKYFVCKIAKVLNDGTVVDLRSNGKNLTSEFDSFNAAFNSNTTARKIRTLQHTKSGKGARSYVKVDKKGPALSGDEYEFYNSAGICYRMDTMTATIEQFGAIDGADVLPILAKAISHSAGLNRVKSEGGEYHIAPGHYTVPNIVNLDLDLRQATLLVDEHIQTNSERLAMPDSASLRISVGVVDFQGKFTWRLFTAFNAKRLRFKNDGEIRGARWPSDENPEDLPLTNLTGVLRYSGDDIKIHAGDCFDMYHKNYDGTLSKGGHLGRIFDGTGKKIRILSGSMKEVRTPIVNHKCDNIKWYDIDFDDVSDNSIYDLDCSNSKAESLTFLNCKDEPIVASGINKKISRCSFIECGGRNIALNGYYRNFLIEKNDFIHSIDLSAIKTRLEVSDISEDLTISDNYFKGECFSGIVNLIGNVRTIRFLNNNRFKIGSFDLNPKYIETFGKVDNLIVIDNDFGDTGENGRVISCSSSVSSEGGPTLLQTWNNKGLKETNMRYSQGAKLPFELRSRENIDPSSFTDIGEYKGNAHFVAPVSDGGFGKGFCISIALDDNVYSQDNVRTGGFFRFVKLNEDNADPSVSMQFWASKRDGSGYELCFEANRNKKYIQ
ncbi:phage tail protein [Vibrio cholerae]